MDFKNVDIISHQMLEKSLDEYGEIRLLLPIIEARKMDRLIYNYRKMISFNPNSIFKYFFYVVQLIHAIYHQYYVHKYPALDHAITFYILNVKRVKAERVKIGDDIGAWVFKRK